MQPGPLSIEETIDPTHEAVYIVEQVWSICIGKLCGSTTESDACEETDKPS